MKSHFPNADLTYRVIGAAFVVHNTLGFGFLESVYRKALAIELGKRGVDCVQEQSYDLLYEGVDVGRYRADLVVNSEVIVEVESGLRLDPTAPVQLLNYLKASNIEVGLVLHFGLTAVEAKRLIMSDVRQGIMESAVSLA